MNPRDQLAIDWQQFRLAQQRWAAVDVRDRISPLVKLPGLLLANDEALFKCLDHRNARSLSQFMSSELLSLAAAAKWHVRKAPVVLKRQSIRHRGLNFYLGRLQTEVIREPYGLVLIIGTWNYPVFLTGVQILQALAAGNAVLVKPAPGAEAVTRVLTRLFVEAGYASDLIQVLDSAPQSVDDCLTAGIDLLIMTASSKTGRLVAAKAAQHLVPVIAELSGCDAMFVLDSAKLEQVADAITFGLRLNHGATCMAPRRVLIGDQRADRLIELLKSRIASITPRQLTPSTRSCLYELLEAAVAKGGALSIRSASRDLKLDELTDQAEVSAIIADHVQGDMQIAKADIFAPVISILRQKNHEMESWLQCNELCSYALTASVFGDPADARKLAARINASMVTINDVIAPTVEPSLSFGGRGESGFGASRGAEGLRQMTREKSILLREGNFLPHFDPPDPVDDGLIRGLFAWLHGQTLRERLTGIRRMVQAVKLKSLSKR